MYLGVVEKVLGAIGTGRLASGDRLPSEQELATLCRASRPTVRDAMLALELFGVVEVRPRSGAYVTDRATGAATRFPTLFDSSPRELLEAREHIEPGVASLCAARVTPTALEELDRLVDESESALSGGSTESLERFLQLGHQFHAALASHCGNETMATVTRQLVDVSAHPLWRVVNGLHLRSMDTRSGQIAEHREILAAIARGDGAAAAAAMRDHLAGLDGSIFGRPRSSGLTRSRRRRVV
jgi:DNA-binding FadR family transcriptional regulator